MSLLMVPGPAQISLGTGASAALEFLGYSEAGVEIRLRAAYRDVYTDFGGPDIASDSQMMGEEAYISFTLTKYNESVLTKAAKRRVATAVTAGLMEANGLGGLMVTGGFAYQIFINSPYSALGYQSSAIAPCYLFYTGWLHDEFTVPLSVQVKKPRCVFRAIPNWNPSALTYQLYTTTPPGSLPTIN